MFMKAQKRKEIRDIGTRLFVEKGFENTTTRDIARAAGISNAALYYYFDSKEELLYQALDETLSNGLKRIKEIEKSSMGFSEKLRAITDMYTKYYAGDIDKMKLLVHDQKSLTPEHKAELDKKQRDYLDVMVNLLKDLRKKGEIRDLDPTVCAFAFFGMVHWAYRWYDPKGKIKPAKLSEIFDQIFNRGIYLDSVSKAEH